MKKVNTYNMPANGFKLEKMLVKMVKFDYFSGFLEDAAFAPFLTESN